MHICYLNYPIEYYSPLSGGALATIIMEEARQLIARGHRVSVLTNVNKDQLYDVGEVIPIQVKTRGELNLIQRGISLILRKLFHWDQPYYEYYLFSFLKALKHLKHKPDAVIVFNDLISPRYIKKILPDTKVIVGLHNEVRTSKKYINRTISCVDMFVTCSTYISNWTREAYGIPLDKLAVAINGVNLETFRPRQDYLKWREVLNILFLGRIDPNKGPDIVAEAVEALQKEGLAVHLTVAGPVRHFDRNLKIEPFLKKLELKMQAVGAEFLGNVIRDNVPALIRSHDVVCVLSRSNEPGALVILEAMASGCAVVASDRGGTPETSGGAALLVNPDDFSAVVEALRLLATDEGFLRTQKIKSLERAAKASRSVNVDILEKILLT